MRTFLESRTNRVRVRTIGDSDIPAGILVECLKSIREQYPAGTQFYATEIKVCKKPDGRIYLRAKDMQSTLRSACGRLLSVRGKVITLS